MQKNVAQPFPTMSSVAVSSTTTYYSAISSILYQDTVGIELSWTGSPVGTFSVQVSNSYKPQLAQSEGSGAPNNGIWTLVPLVNPVTSVVSTTLSTSIGSPIFLNLNQLGAAWIQIVYINSSGTGTINAMITAKSLG